MGKLIVGVLVRLCYIAIGALLGMMYIASASAATMRGNVEVCKHFGSTAISVADLRDGGVPWEVFGPWIEDQVKAALLEPDSYVKDADDYAFVMDWFKRMYESKLDGPTLAAMIEQDCMAVQKTALRRGKRTHV